MPMPQSLTPGLLRSPSAGRAAGAQHGTIPVTARDEADMKETNETESEKHRQAEGALAAGAAEVEITPAPGVHMAGDMCRLRPVERILDPLCARAIVFSNPGDLAAARVCLLSLDLCTVGDDAADDIRARVSERFGFRKEEVMLHLLQNHSAPALGGHLLMTPDCPQITHELWWTYQGDPGYFDYLVPRLLDAVNLALERVEPVSMGCGGMADGRIAFNRRFVMRDGWVQTQARDLTEILHPEGPADPEVGVACFKNRDGEIIAALLHHTAHPVSHFGKPWVTASWPGQWARQMKSILGEGCVPVVLNGCCGNVNRHSPIPAAPAADDEQAGQWLTETSQKVLSQMTWQDVADVGVKSQTISIPYGRIEEVIGPEAVEDSHTLVGREPEPRWLNAEHTAVDIEWMFAVVTLDVCRRLAGGAYDYEVQTFRLGDLAIVGLTGEPFVEGQLRVKGEAPAKRTFVAHMCNGWVGYIPTLHAYRAKNYNFRNAAGKPVRRGANLFLLAPDALDRIVTASLDLLEGLCVDA